MTVQESFPSQNSRAGQLPRKSTFSEIKRSWQRCTEQYHLEPGANIGIPKLSQHEITNAREALDELLHVANPVLNRLRQLGENSGYCVLISDANGVALRQFIDTQRGRELADSGLTVGTVWSENLVGTNGLGTCLATGDSLTVYADEHFDRKFRRYSCSTAPLISPKGDIIGALDISTYARGDKLGQGLALNIVCETADQIEAAMFKSAYANYHLISLVSSPLVDPVQSNAILAVCDSGMILGATTQALLQMGFVRRDSLVGHGIKNIINGSLEDVVQSPQPLLSNHYAWLMYQRAPKPKSIDVGYYRSSKLITNKKDSPLYDAAGSDPLLLKNADICHRIINRNINVLLQGETGTGKEVWAQAIHNSSERKDKPFVTLNCAAIPESLIESELFGYSAGTFTGGLKGGKVGKIEASNGGTLFLDEIGDMPLALQARLLRVLAEQEITPLGQIQAKKVSLNVVCATHRDLHEKVAQGQFRQDLYYRISGVKVLLPSLRERSDKMELIDKLLLELTHGQGAQLTESAEYALIHYQWPGNIRQLKNTLHYALCMCENAVIDENCLPAEILNHGATFANYGVDSYGGDVFEGSFSTDFSNESSVFNSHSNPAIMSPLPQASCASKIPQRHSVFTDASSQTPTEASKTEEEIRIINALENHRWVVSKAAKALSMSRSTLHRKINKYQIYNKSN
ncbi:sigma-54-dependent Fis family transcriptional regulator [Sessilibacter sp. MAH4]